MRCLEHGDGEDTCSKSEELAAHGLDGSSASVDGDAWGSRGPGTVYRRLDLAITNPQGSQLGCKQSVATSSLPG